MKAGGTAGSIVYIHHIVLDKRSLPLNYLYKIIASTNTLIQPWLMINELREQNDICARSEVNTVNQIKMCNLPFPSFYSFLKRKKKKKPSYSSGGLGMRDRNAVELL